MKQNSQKQQVRIKPSIFISHYAKDAELADMLKKLFANICGDEIRIFLSTDKSHGIPYSGIWFQTILSEIDNASAMLCLLTPRSIYRPWIFWEAGTAFGKGKPVYGLAIGLSLSEACVGPFAQFQNCGDDAKEMKKLIKTILLLVGVHAEESRIAKAVEHFRQVKKHVLLHNGPRLIEKHLQPDKEVALLLNKMHQKFFAVDGIIEICRSVGYSGWTRHDLENVEIVGHRRLPDVFYTYDKEDVRCEKGSQARFTLKSITEPLHDAERSKIKIVFALSSYADLYRLSRLLDLPFIEESGEKRTGREAFGNSWFPLESSPLVHNVNTQPIVITKDNTILLVKRSKSVHHYPGCWSASLEEQMVAPGDDMFKADTSLFDCAERAVREELSCRPIPTSTRILSMGIEFANMSASFICLVYIEESFNEVCNSWIRRASDQYEAYALDCIPFERNSIEKVLNHRFYSPSSMVFCRVDSTKDAWHPSARMRLYALMCNMDEVDQDGMFEAL